MGNSVRQDGLVDFPAYREKHQANHEPKITGSKSHDRICGKRAIPGEATARHPITSHHHGLSIRTVNRLYGLRSPGLVQAPIVASKSVALEQSKLQRSHLEIRNKSGVVEFMEG